MSISRIQTRPTNDIKLNVVQCIDEFQDLVNQYNRVKEYLAPFSETERAEFIRKYIFTPFCLLLLTGAILTTATCFFIANFIASDDSKATYQNIASISMWSLLAIGFFQMLFTTPSDGYSFSFRRKTCRISEEEAQQLSRLLFSLDNFRTLLMSLFGERNESMQLLYTDLQRLQMSLSDEQQPIKVFNDTLNYASIVFTHAQTEVSRHPLNEAGNSYAFNYNGRFFEPNTPPQIMIAVADSLDTPSEPALTPPK